MFFFILKNPFKTTDSYLSFLFVGHSKARIIIFTEFKWTDIYLMIAQIYQDKGLYHEKYQEEVYGIYRGCQRNHSREKFGFVASLHCT